MLEKSLLAVAVAADTPDPSTVRSLATLGSITDTCVYVGCVARARPFPQRTSSLSSLAAHSCKSACRCGSSAPVGRQYISALGPCAYSLINVTWQQQQEADQNKQRTLKRVVSLLMAAAPDGAEVSLHLRLCDIHLLDAAQQEASCCGKHASVQSSKWTLRNRRPAAVASTRQCCAGYTGPRVHNWHLGLCLASAVPASPRRPCDRPCRGGTGRSLRSRSWHVGGPRHQTPVCGTAAMNGHACLNTAAALLTAAAWAQVGQHSAWASTCVQARPVGPKPAAGRSVPARTSEGRSCAQNRTLRLYTVK